MIPGATARAPQRRAAPHDRPPPPASSIRVVLALAHAEGKRLLRRPVFVGFGALTVLALWFTEGDVADLNRAYALGLAFFPICAGVLLATNFATLRSRQAGSEEVFGVTPTPPAIRTVAHILASIHASAVGVVLILAWLVVQRAGDAIGWPHPFEALMGPVLMIGAGAVGVMVARMIPNALAALPAIVLIAMITGELNSLDGARLRLEWLAPFPGDNDGLPALIWPRPTGMHVVYLLALATLISSIAVLRHARGRRVVAAALLAAVVAGVTGWEHSRPPSERDVDAAIAWLTEPERTCRARDGVRLCAYPGYEQLIDRWSDAITPVLTHAPVQARARTLIVEQLPPPSMFATIPAVLRSRLPARVLDGSWRRDGALHPEFGWASGPISAISLSLQASSWIVGLPTEPTTRPATARDFEGDEPIDDRFPATVIGDPVETPCYAGGQARAVIALWLTGLAHEGRSTFNAAFNLDPDDGMTSGGVVDEQNALLHIGPPDWIAEIPRAVTWTVGDLRAALELLDRADAGDAIRSRWAQFVDPSTTSEQLARMLDLPPQPVTPAPEEMPICG